MSAFTDDEGTPYFSDEEFALAEKDNEIYDLKCHYGNVLVRAERAEFKILQALHLDGHATGGLAERYQWIMDELKRL